MIKADHKPLQAISTQPLSQVPLILQKMILNVRRYDVELCYIRGSKQVLADTLSRASAHSDKSGDDEEFEAINLVLSVSDERYEKSQKETKVDPELQAVGEKWMARHKSTSSCRGKTVLDISR